MSTSFSRTTRSLTQDSSFYAVMAWLLGGLFLLAWLVWLFFAKITVYEISAKARLEVNRSSHPIASMVSGKIIAIAASLGQQVKSGDVLLTLDSNYEQLRLREEESKLGALPPQISALEKQIQILEQAKTESNHAELSAIESAKARHNEAKSAAAFAKENERRLKMLGSAGGIPVIETLRAQAESEKLYSSKAALSSDIQRLTMESQTRNHQRQADMQNLKANIARLKGDISTTKTTIERLKQEIEYRIIRAPAAGKIGDLVQLQIGTVINVGEKLGTIVPKSELKIVADFPPESVFGRIHPGQAGRMRLDGFPWMQFGTVVAQVSRVGSEIRDNLVRVEFTPNLVQPPKIQLQHGLPGSIEVSVEEVSPAVMVLRSIGQKLTPKPTQKLSNHP